ncbi:hypothetical protein FSP39_022284 [Pinctada imbricata]|uniref:Ig-like domain-containing protein n=1 Tax=Pinctada imbricata TaxID=66713 RepID=A0AA88Y5W4_PINIB|nr:hypothetical protein FSP39_022284 [Pinctada imbricata]
MTGYEVVPYIIILLSFRQTVLGFQLNIHLPSDPSSSVRCQDHLVLQASTAENTLYNRLGHDYSSVSNTTSLPKPNTPHSTCTFSLTKADFILNGTNDFKVTKIHTRKERTLSLTCSVESRETSVTLHGQGIAEISAVSLAGRNITIKLYNIQYSNKGIYVCKDASSDILMAWNVTVLEWEHRRGNVTLRTLPGINTVMESTLELSTCGYQDAGNYVCRVKDSTGEVVEKAFALDVYAPPVKTNETFTVKDTLASISVYFYSVPEPLNIKWTKEGRLLQNGTKYHMKSTNSTVHLKVFRKLVNTQGFLSTLDISGPSANDFGEYIFHIENQFGTVTTTINLTNPKAVGTAAGLLLIFVIVVVSARCCKLPAKKGKHFQREKRDNNTLSE